MKHTPLMLRSMLFVPGHRTDLLEKALRSETDAVILDLEDAVAPDEKPRARATLSELPESSVPIYVRSNAAETEWFWDDIVACGQAGVAGVVIPKAQDRNVISALDGALTVLEKSFSHEPQSTSIAPLIESATGVRETFNIIRASGRVRSVLFSSGEQGDLVADLGVEWTPEGTALMYARSKVLLDCRAAGLGAPMDAVFMDFRNLDALRSECELARRLGYVGKVAIHPAQIAVINEVFTPTPPEVAHAERIVEAFDEAISEGKASIGLDGKMVDYAVARVARGVLQRATLATRFAERTAR